MAKIARLKIAKKTAAEVERERREQDNGDAPRLVSGILFGDYVRMIRAHDEVDWAWYLTEEDLPYLKVTIEPTGWYPFDTFERMGIGIVTEVAAGDMEQVRQWGRDSIDRLYHLYKSMISEGDPRESMMRYQVMRRSLFNFDPVKIKSLYENFARIEINYGMSPLAEQAAAHQTAGYFERLIELSGAANVSHKFTSRAWEESDYTGLELEWGQAVRTRLVRGGLFTDLARAIKSQTEVDWSPYLDEVDLAVLDKEIASSEWRPLGLFEKMIKAVFVELVKSDLEFSRRWGKVALGRVLEEDPELLAPGNPKDSLMRLLVRRRKNFLNFDPIRMRALSDDSARFEINLEMGPEAESAAVYDLLGHLEGMVERAGGRAVTATFINRGWERRPPTLLELTWSPPEPTRRVSGIFFSDYVRMIKAHPEVDWSRYLEPADLPYLEAEIKPAGWYPVDVFERMGTGIVTEIAQKKMDVVSRWGSASVDDLHDVHRSLIVEGDPTETLLRAHVYTENFFDFKPFTLKHLQDSVAKIQISFGMNSVAEEGACYQTAGYLERLLELAGARNVQYWFTEMAWDGDPATMLEMMWEDDVSDRRVKGILFLDYVRMVKSRKDVDWSKYLTEADLELLNVRIDNDEWYPFDAFERMGLGIVTEIAGGDMEKVRLWGFFSIDELFNRYPDLIAKDDPPESLMRFQVLRRSFFDFDAVRILDLRGESAAIEINYEMNDLAEQSASWQTLGFFQRLLVLSGAEDIEYTFESNKWEGAPATVLSLSWTRREQDSRSGRG